MGRRLTEEQRLAANERSRRRYADDPAYRERRRAENNAWHAAHPTYKRDRLRAIPDLAEREAERHLVKTYGLTAGAKAAMLEAQGGRCPVCGTDEPGGNKNAWHVHHDHGCCAGTKSCGRCVVALLCARCNLGTGLLGDDPGRLRAAADLLERGSVTPC